MLGRVKNFYSDSVFRVITFENKIDVINYAEIDHFDDSKIIIRYKSGVVVISGKNLIISKLLDDEILIDGKIKLVEFR